LLLFNIEFVIQNLTSRVCRPVTVIPVWAAAGFTCSRFFSPAAAAAAAAATTAIGILMFSTMPELAYRRSGEVCGVFVINITTDIRN
jgi:hypothetical protein